MDNSDTTARAAAPDMALNRSYIDWPAILAGAVIAAAAGAIFTTFGAALGLSAISAEPGEGSGTVALILSGLWIVISMVATYATGGYIAGRMRRRVDQATADEVTVRDGINGLVVWAVGMLFGAMVLINAASSVVSGAGAVASTAVEATGAAIGGVAQGAMSAAGVAASGSETNPMDFVTDTLLRPETVDPAAEGQDLSGQVGRVLANIVTSGEISDADRAFLERAVAAEAGVPPAEVSARVDQAIAQAQDARTQATQLAEEAKQTAIDAAESARIGSILTAFAIAAASLAAAAAAYIGAVRGGRHRDEGRIFGGFAFRG